MSASRPQSWRRVAVDAGIAAAAIGLGFLFFSPFERHTPVALRALRFLLFVGVTGVISRKAGRRWALVFVFGWLAIGATFHAWWTHAHGIELLRPEPRERYYRARGWPWPEDAGS
ncbi:MAG TPA: hypothetical protein VFA20_19245 [Myxococcaceae bacterium]|nr:hypothetical protein [Myxococcaceae bacterium]